MLANTLRQRTLAAARRTPLVPTSASLAPSSVPIASTSAAAFGTTVSGAAASSPKPTPPPRSPHHDEKFLSWNQYLQLRRSRRLAGLVTTVPTTALAATAAGSYFLTLEVDPTNAIAGIDPTFIYAGLTLAFTGLGWLTGPTIGSSIWTLLHRKQAKQIAQKDHDFFEHIKRRRVDPSRQSMQNPVPDFYGEKIGSVKQYRQWLRDQAAYRRKAAHGLDADV
ncbi:uncharacterized protein PFL1_06555 [Pseudozyma flocculosa PF-1]|uniref:Presequence translocated-associated motor subunit PAM17 n=2 Tax=Pseudozyma flocculosa TaxID=84751 RepID=A0A5C3FB99_9BASI|nr:uncharacterized protein PFL1_06555 [Pseudozyma flocculosa PF-1]EPQ25881.1 hypothetical protein PFL1_06555 [Pseudozyma flocculosa PF-1]SPO40619.1 related to PAM17 - constituent of the TIM23 complex [Pseudozyma flocculosa]